MLYPIGQQDFASIRNRGFVYVDKTDLIYKMASEGTYYFLSRPRRFGKSLLLSTLKNYFCGNKELFKGLAIEQLEQDWIQYPVFHLDLAKGDYSTIKDLQVWLDFQISKCEKQFPCEEKAQNLATRFSDVITRAHEQTGQQVVVLIDEYDAPMQAALDYPELMAQFQSLLRDIYLCLKTNNEHIRFTFITGITVWGKMGVFSALNNLKDISINEKYATICGVTERELHEVFHNPVVLLAEKNKMTVDEAYTHLKEMYDGYHFAVDAPGVYNPFSLLQALQDRTFDNYWISTGGTQVVANLVSKVKIDIDALQHEMTMPRENILSSSDYRNSPNTFLYQAGYLTLCGQNQATKWYNLKIPNGEVRDSLAFHLVAPTFGFEQEKASNFINNIKNAMYNGKIDVLVQTLNDYIFRKENYYFVKEYLSRGNDHLFQEKPEEKFFQHVLYIVFLSAGYNTQAEVIGRLGRADLVVQTPTYIYIIETKLNKTAKQAFDQINEKAYADTYLTEGKPIIMLGLNFAEKERIIDDFTFEKVNH